MQSVFMLGVVIKLYTPSVIMLGVFKMGVFMLSIIMLSVFMLSVIMLSVVVLNVTAPTKQHLPCTLPHTLTHIQEKNIFSIIFILYFRHFLQKSMYLFENLISL
jgi:hypothetical protein